jgi:hypothetical protein
MPRKPIGDRPMTDAEHQARHRAARATGKPASRIRSPADRRSRVQRWRDAVAEALERPPEVPAIGCASLAETAAEKLVSAGTTICGVVRSLAIAVLREIGTGTPAADCNTALARIASRSLGRETQ